MLTADSKRKESAALAQEILKSAEITSIWASKHLALFSACMAAAEGDATSAAEVFLRISQNPGQVMKDVKE